MTSIIDGMDMDKPLIYAIDDEPGIRKLYLESLPLGGYQVEVGDGGSALFSLLLERRPSLIILDVMLDGEDGYEILTRLKGEPRYADIPVIMVSAKGEEVDKVKGLNLGADDYISKPFGIMELFARINANIRKRPQSEVSSYLDLEIDKQKRIAYLKGEPISLTKLEFDLLSYLVNKNNQICPKDELLSKVWGISESLETRTLDIHVFNLRKKITSSKAKIETIRGVGYSLV